MQALIILAKVGDFNAPYQHTLNPQGLYLLDADQSTTKCIIDQSGTSDCCICPEYPLDFGHAV